MHQHAFLQAVVASLLAVSAAFGHGKPIHLSLGPGNKLKVANGTPDSLGFAPMLFFEIDEDGDPVARNASLPAPFTDSTYVLYETPGLDIVGLDPESNLSIEVLLRPVQGMSPPEHRTLWYWTESTGVAPAPVEKLILISEGPTFAAITPTDLVAPPSLLVEDVIGIPVLHSHSYLKFAIDNTPTAPVGAYGFFARFTSTFCDESTGCYTPSDPFLIVLNRDDDYELMDEAAFAINAAAKVAPPPGDYDGNGQVEPADYQYWRERFSNSVAPFTSPDGNGNGFVDATDYVIWRNAFSQSAAGKSAIAVIPESRAIALAISAIFLSATIWRDRRLSPCMRRLAR